MSPDRGCVRISVILGCRRGIEPPNASTGGEMPTGLLIWFCIFWYGGRYDCLFVPLSPGQTD